MNVLEVEPKDFRGPEISLVNLKMSYAKYIPFQDFVWMKYGSGILVLKDRHGPTGLFFSE